MDNEEEMSFADIYSSVALNDEVILTVALEDVENVKVGLKNYKAKQNIALQREGLPKDDTVLSFQILSSNLEEGTAELSIFLQRKGVVKVKGIRIPTVE